MDPQAIEREMVSRLHAALEDRLIAVVEHGPAVHDDDYHHGDTAYLLIVVADLEAPTLHRLAGPIRWWLRRGQPWPRLFAPGQLRDAADVFPVELLDIVRHHRVLHGVDPLHDIVIDDQHLRLQCERELRERLMRLCEGYVEADQRAGAVRELIEISYPSFAQVFRACLHLLGEGVPRHDREVVARLCARLDLDPAPLAAAGRIARGDDGDPIAAFAGYHRALRQLEARIDRWIVHREENLP